MQQGRGTRKDAYHYSLPGMVEKWQADFMSSFMKRLEAGPGGASPPP